MNLLESSREIEDLVLRFRSGDRQAGEILLEKFKPLIGKYMNIFLKGVFNPQDTDALKFLKCCGVISHSNDYTKIAKNIKYQLRNASLEDIEQACKIALLVTATQYVNIAGSYKFVLLEYIRPLMSDVAHVDVDINTLAIQNYEPTYGQARSLDSDWIRGDTAGEGFCLLTAEERQIAIFLWEKHVSDEAICKKFNMSKYELRKIKNKIKATLKEALNIK